MNAALAIEVVQALTERLGRAVSIMRVQPASGGCINHAVTLHLDDGSACFLKYNDSAPEGFFEAEAAGLSALAASGGLRVPRPFASGGGAEGVPPYLLMENIAGAPTCPDHAERLGRGLAHVHRMTAEAFGFEEDNFIGSTPQSNPRIEDWPGFFAEARLRPMLALLAERGRSTPELSDRMGKLLERLPGLVGKHSPPPALVHGDLWSGNVMSDETGAPVLIDPAVHFADREVDIAMTELFGRFPSEFYAAYREAWPLPPGYEMRRDLYNLYHLLNHVHLFGLSYMSGAMSIVRRYT